MTEVVFIHSSVKHYREAFFDALHDGLRLKGIKLKIVFGEPTFREQSKGDTFAFERPWAKPVKNIWFFKERLLYQPVWKEVKTADLVIVEQANKHLINYLLLLSRRFLGIKVAFWGHGRNSQARPGDIRERFKRMMLRTPDWWFAYTQTVSDYLNERGVRPEAITTVQNSIDTTSFKHDLNLVSAEDLERVRKRHGLGVNDMIGLFCGSLYPEKRIDFLLESACKIKEKIPNFNLIVLGGGQLRHLVEHAATETDWIHFVGPCFGTTKAEYFRLANLFLGPVSLGLSIIDAFCAGLPVVTTDRRRHGPEIDYLNHGVNGLCSTFDSTAYAELIAELCADQSLLVHLQQGAIQSGEKYSLETMVTNVCGGIIHCLAS